MILTKEIKIIKREGYKTRYDSSKIIFAITKAMSEGETGINVSIAEEIEKEIYDEVTNDVHQHLFTVENIQDMIEDKLMLYGRYNTAKRFIRYRENQKNQRLEKWKMSDLQYDIWSQKYEWENEGWEKWLDRVSGKNPEIKKLIRQKKFLFGGRILASRGLQNIGRKITFSNCYVLAPPEDNIESIFDTGSKLARTFSYGGGCGVDIGKLRPNGARVQNAALTTSGAISFMDFYSKITEIIGQKGRRGALMISIPVSHPDIEEFIDIKKDLNKITKANISIRFTDDFMNAVKEDKMYTLNFFIDATKEHIVKEVNARNIFKKFSQSNWDMAEPGALFWSKIENYNLLSNDDRFEFAGVNPCAEEPLPAGGSCLLGSINLSEFVSNPFLDNAKFDFNKFEDAVKIATIGLNEVLDEGLSLHPLQEQQDSVANWRQIGLGIMGLSDMLIKMNIPYGSDESIKLCDKIGYLMFNASAQQSCILAKQNGSYPMYSQESILSSMFLKANANTKTIDMIKKYGLRNSQLLTVAPTGSLSTMLGISGGIEPIYQISYTRKTQTLNNGDDSFYKVFTPIAREYLDKKDLTKEEDLPNDLFITAMTLEYDKRLKMQSIWQKHIDASISSTVNVPYDFTINDTIQLYLKAWEYGLKGVTIFRDKCRRIGILTNGDTNNINNLSVKELQELLNKQISKELQLDPTKCPKCGGKMIMTGGCSECEDCAYSPCSI